MNLLFVSLCLGLWMIEGTQGKMFPCNFNVYEEIRDGCITAEEFFTYTKKHGFDAEKSNVAFGMFDQNADGQIEVSEFVHALPSLQQNSLIGRCTRSISVSVSVSVSIGK